MFGQGEVEEFHSRTMTLGEAVHLEVKREGAVKISGSSGKKGRKAWPPRVSGNKLDTMGDW